MTLSTRDQFLHPVLGFYDALGRGDVAALLGLMDPQIQWTEAERFPYYTGTWVGPQAVVDNLLAPLAVDWSAFSAHAYDHLVEGDRIVSFGDYRGTYKKTGKSMTAPFAHHWTVREGKLTSFRMYTDTAKVLEALAH